MGWVKVYQLVPMLTYTHQAQVGGRPMVSCLREVRVFVRVDGSHLREVRVATRVEGFHLREVRSYERYGFRREVRVLRATRSPFPPTGIEGSYKG